LKFLAHHLWDPAKREAQRKHGMPQDAAESLREDGLLRSEGPHAPTTVRRRLSSWATLYRWRGIEGYSPLFCPALGAAAGGSGVGSSPSLEEAARGYARRARPVARDLRVGPSGRPARRRDPDGRVCIGRTAAQRGCAAAYRAASRRAVRAPRSCRRRFDALPCLAIRLGRTKTAAADEEGSAFLVVPPIEAWGEWLQRADITKRPVFRRSTGGAPSRTGR
jgi:hypothetical protein